MRLKTVALSTASLAALAFAGPAWAQTAPATPAEAAAEAQANPADPEPAADEPADDAIVVTGLRRSLQSARNIKRNSDQIVDAIVAEDIGKLPDRTVSDTAARIPGIQVERRGGEADRVLVRGLDARVFSATTYNGREVFTAETRTVSLQDFPAASIGAVEVFKTSTANLVEPGLGGLVNVRGRRPFDFSEGQVAGSAWAHYPNQSRDVGYNGNILLTDRWDVGNGEIGALIGASYTQFHYQDSIRRHGFGIFDLPLGVPNITPDFPEIQYAEAKRERPSINGTVQWKPSPGVQLYAEGLWQGYREDVEDRRWEQPLWNGQSYSNIVFDGNKVVSGRVVSPGCVRCYRAGIQGATTRKTDTFQFAVGGSYDAGPLLLTADFARSKSRFDLEVESFDYQLNRTDFTVDFFTGKVGGDGPTFQVTGFDFANPRNYEYRGLFEEYLTAKGDDWQGRFDAEYELGLSFLPKVQAGVRYVTRDASRTVGSRFAFLGDLDLDFTEVPLQFELFKPAFRGDDNKPAPLTWLSPTFRSLRQNTAILRGYNDTLGRGFGPNDPLPDPNRTYTAGEESMAAYGQLHYGATLSGVELSGQLGLRVVKTKNDLVGTINVPGTAPQAVDYSPSYTDWLPNFNLRAELNRSLVMRFAATQTRTRPEFNQLNPSIGLDPPVVCSPGASSCIRRGGGGNPFLEPLNSNNYDASLEYYFSRTGLAAITAFRRDIRGFIANTSYSLPGTDAAGATLVIGGPVNTNKGRITGFEVQARTFFDFEALPAWARNFGVEANATYLDAKADFLMFQNDNRAVSAGGNRHVRRLTLPDVSKWSYNLTGMYENARFSSRLSYNWRGKYQEGDLDFRTDNFTYQGRGRGGSRLDLSTNYNLNDKFTVFFDWNNILKQPFRSDIQRTFYSGGQITGLDEFPMVVRFEETVLSSGIRFRL